MKRSLLLAFIATSALMYSCSKTQDSNGNTINITSCLVAYYPFNGNANDMSGSGNNGTVNGATLTTDRFGNPNSAYNFDATHWSSGSTRGDEIYIPYNYSFNSANISVSVWLQRTSSGAPSQRLSVIRRFQYGYNNPNGQAWVIEMNPSDGYLTNTWALNAAATNTQTTLGIHGIANQINTWYHVVFTFDGKQFKQYINGVMNSSTSLAGWSINTAGNSGISIGVSDQANGYWAPFGGKIDDIYIYCRALSDAEVQYLYTH